MSKQLKAWGGFSFRASAVVYVHANPSQKILARERSPYVHFTGISCICHALLRARTQVISVNNKTLNPKVSTLNPKPLNPKP